MIILDFITAVIDFLKSDEAALAIEITVYIFLAIFVFVSILLAVNCGYLWKWCIVQEIRFKG